MILTLLPTFSYPARVVSPAAVALVPHHVEGGLEPCVAVIAQHVDLHVAVLGRHGSLHSMEQAITSERFRTEKQQNRSRKGSSTV